MPKEELKLNIHRLIEEEKDFLLDCLRTFANVVTHYYRQCFSVPVNFIRYTIILAFVIDVLAQVIEQYQFKLNIFNLLICYFIYLMLMYHSNIVVKILQLVIVQ